MNSMIVCEPNGVIKKCLCDALHSLGYVRGDLCPQNILALPDNSIRIVDFDWCGPVGEAKYPADINLSEDCGWHKDVTSGGLILKEHDGYQISVLANYDPTMS